MVDGHYIGHFFKSPDPVNFAHQHHLTSFMHLCGADNQAVHFITAEMYLRKSAEPLWIIKINFIIILSMCGVERRLTRPLFINK